MNFWNKNLLITVLKIKLLYTILKCYTWLNEKEVDTTPIRTFNTSLTISGSFTNTRCGNWNLVLLKSCSSCSRSLQNLSKASLPASERYGSSFFPGGLSGKTTKMLKLEVWITFETETQFASRKLLLTKSCIKYTIFLFCLTFSVSYESCISIHHVIKRCRLQAVSNLLESKHYGPQFLLSKIPFY